MHAELPGELENAAAGHLGWSVARPKTKRKKIRYINKHLSPVFDPLLL